MSQINLTPDQQKYIDLINEHGNGAVLFNDTSKVFISNNGWFASDDNIEIPYKIFCNMDFIGILEYGCKIGRDQYFYRLSNKFLKEKKDCQIEKQH